MISSPEQAQKDQQADDIARDFALLVEAGAERIEDRPHRHRVELHAALAVAQHGGHRRQQARRRRNGEAGIGAAKFVHPAHFGVDAQHLAERIEDTDDEHADDQPVQSRIGHEGGFDLREKDCRDEADQHDEEQHSRDIGVRARQREAVLVFLRHASSLPLHIRMGQPPDNTMSTRSCGPLSDVPPSARTRIRSPTTPSPTSFCLTARARWSDSLRAVEEVSWGGPA